MVFTLKKTVLCLTQTTMAHSTQKSFILLDWQHLRLQQKSNMKKGLRNLQEWGNP
jgi:hypothetical protein